MKSEKEKKDKIVEAEIVEKEAKSEAKKDKKEEKKKAKKKDKKNKEESKIKTNKKEGFFKEVIKELKRVKWPDKKYMIKYSLATFGTIIISSLYFYAIFALFSYIKGLI
jgi:preprotein translocase SecE subunit